MHFSLSVKAIGMTVSGAISGLNLVTIMSNAPDAPSGQQDFIKGWPHPSMIDREPLKAGLSESFAKSIAEHAVSCLDYGTKEQGAFMLGHPAFLEALGGYLSTEYGQDVPAANLMSTGGASMATDIACRVHAAYGDCVVSEAPTYYLGHNMFKERGLRLREVPIQPDGMDMDALEEVLKEEGGKVKMVYTIPVHHNPTGITMCNEKRVRLVALAKQYDFKILADEAYQLVSFTDPGVVSLHFHDDPADPRVLAIGTFSKLIGPGIKVGWVHAYPELLKPMSGIGFIDSGNNPVIFNSCGMSARCCCHTLRHLQLMLCDISPSCATESGRERRSCWVQGWRTSSPQEPSKSTSPSSMQSSVARRMCWWRL